MDFLRAGADHRADFVNAPALSQSLRDEVVPETVRSHVYLAERE